MAFEKTIRVALSDRQWELITAPERYVDAEGAARSGKTFAACWKMAQLVANYPGIQCLASRYTEEDTHAQLAPTWHHIAEQAGLVCQWKADEACDDIEVAGGVSRVYLRGLKAGDETRRYAKFAGLTLAFIWIDQAEELPLDYYESLKARLSQPGFPQQMLLTPNPPDEGHWLCRAFPDDGRTRPDHRYLRFSLEDNRRHIGAAYIAKQQAAYPVGSPLRRRFVDGRRGLTVKGEPVYARVFDRAWHVSEAATFAAELPLYEAWDFGHRHPAVLWAQQVGTQWRLLGELLGDRQFLDDFVRLALALRQQIAPNPLAVETVCDPAGAAESAHGVRPRAVDVLHEFGLIPRTSPDANMPARRYAAIQAIASLLAHRVAKEPALLVHPRCRILIDGFEAGYVWDDRLLALRQQAGLRIPLKDGYYDHLQNCLEYLMQHFGPVGQSLLDAGSGQSARLARRLLRARQFDPDPWHWPEQMPARRGGY